MNLQSLLTAFWRHLLKSAATAIVAFSASAQASSFNCEFVISPEWGTGASATVSITNTSDTVADWSEVTLSFPDDESVTIHSSWDAVRTGNGPATFTPYSWNKSLAPHQKITIGMQLAKPSSGDFPGGNLGGDCAANQAPVADFSISTFESLVSLDASSSYDPDGDALTYSWTLNGRSYASGSYVGSVYLSKGDHVITLTVSDGEASTSITKDFHQWYPPTYPPHATYFYNTDGMSVNFDASESRALGVIGNYISSYNWDFGDGSQASGETVSHTYVEPGVYEVSLRVYDSNLDYTDFSKSVIVNGFNTPPVAAMSLSVFRDTINMDGSASSDADGERITYQWAVDGEVISTGSNETLGKKVELGTHTVSLTVSDGKSSHTVTDTITVQEYPTDAIAVINASLDGANLSYSTTGSYPSVGGFSISAFWDYGDGNTSTRYSGTHTYAAPGTYEITLTITDNLGESATATETVVVESSTP